MADTYAPYSSEAYSLETANTLFRKVYQYMALGLVLTALAAYFTASSRAMIEFLYSSQTPMMILVIAELALVVWLSAGINSMSSGTARTVFLLYSIINGVTLSSVILVYTSESVYKAFLSAAGMFGAMSIYGIYTQRDLTGWGSFLRMGLFGLIIAMVINMFVGSSMAEMYISVFGIIIFLGLTAYDTAKIKAMAYSFDGNDEEMTGKIAVIGALQLYLDFINLFLYLLRLFASRKRR